MSYQEGPLWTLFEQLRRRRFPLGLEDYHILRGALRAGFGWSSRQALRDLCCALWSKSTRERELLIALFDQLKLDEWKLREQTSEGSAGSSWPRTEPSETALEEETAEDEMEPSAGVYEEGLEQLPLSQSRNLPFILLETNKSSNRPFVFVPQFPLTYREIAQAWRRLRRPVRMGPRVELDVQETVDKRCRLGIGAPIVLVPRRRNTARLLLLIDRQGSMSPFHRFTDEVCDAIQQSGKLEHAALYYFHDVPAEGADESVLNQLSDKLFPTLDGVLSQIPPLAEGEVYADPTLNSMPVKLSDVLNSHAAGAAVVILSDAGAARGNYDIIRLLDTVAFVKALRAHTTQYVWLNPLPERYWGKSTAAQIARHIPMLPLDQQGIYRAVNILRGQPFSLENPV